MFLFINHLQFRTQAFANMRNLSQVYYSHPGF